MTSQQKSPNSRRRRLRLQFSLQTMLALILLAAVTCAVLLKPKLEEETWAEGAFKIRAQRTAPTAEPNATPNAQEPPQHNGPWILYDRYHTKLVEGFYHDDVPAGRWKYLDRKGRPLLQGNVEDSACAGTWIARAGAENSGRQVTFDQQERRRKAGPAKPRGTTPECALESFRDGPAKQTWENGNTRAEGEYEGGERQGHWVFYDRDGRKTVEGSYHHGLKQGLWRRSGESAGTEANEYFVGGRKIPDIEAMLKRLENDLLHGDRRHRIAAATVLESFGTAAVPIFRRALANDEAESQLLAIRRLHLLGPAAAAAADDLGRACQHSNARIKFVARVALTEVDPQQAERLYADLLHAARDKEPAIQNLAQQAILRAGPEGVNQLVETMKSSDASVSTMALEAIAALYVDRTSWGTGHGDRRVTLQTIVNLLESVKDDLSGDIHTDAERFFQRGTLAPPRLNGR